MRKHAIQWVLFRSSFTVAGRKERWKRWRPITSHHVHGQLFTQAGTQANPPPPKKVLSGPTGSPWAKCMWNDVSLLTAIALFCTIVVRMNSKEGFQAIIIGRSPAGGLWRCPIWLLWAGGIWRSHVSLVWFADESSSAERETEKRTKLVSSSPESSEPLM